MRIINKFLVIFLLLVLSSCVLKKNYNVLSDFESHLIYKGDYRSYLGLEYLDFARRYRAVDDNYATEYFSTKGLRVITDEDIIPENPRDWNADESQIELMMLMQTRLENLMGKEYLQKNIPIQLAHLVYLYDCWIARESNSVFIADEMARCRVRFIKLLNEIEYYLANINRDRSKPIKIEKPEFELFRINFDFDSSNLNDKAFYDLYKALSYIESINRGFKVLLVGNADRLGSKIYNKALSLNRVLTVKNYLIKNGVDESFIISKALGEEFPEIITFDGKSNQPNRSVEIYVITGLSDYVVKELPVPLVKNQVYQNEIRKARQSKGLNN